MHPRKLVSLDRERKKRLKWLDILTSQHDFMQISAAIIEKLIFYCISASIADNRQNKKYRPML